jgi:hypothetical protein
MYSTGTLIVKISPKNYPFVRISLYKLEGAGVGAGLLLYCTTCTCAYTKSYKYIYYTCRIEEQSVI